MLLSHWQKHLSRGWGSGSSLLCAAVASPSSSSSSSSICHPFVPPQPAMFSSLPNPLLPYGPHYPSSISATSLLTSSLSLLSSYSLSSPSCYSVFSSCYSVDLNDSAYESDSIINCVINKQNNMILLNWNIFIHKIITNVK